jgi:hypothetical protein
MIRTIALFGVIAACNSDYELKGASINEDGAPLPEEEEEEEVFEAPIAVCSVDPDVVRPITGSADFLGDESYDPAELELSYNWKMVDQPVGSTVSMPTGDANRYDFVPDLAGEYVAELTVTNSAGVSSEPCEAVLTAEPAEALWVELYWENDGDDMDLHLLAPGGGLETDLDCYFANCAPSFFSSGLDWGVIGDTTDDPSLDLDDIPNAGPENINIEEPEEGVFTVVVHDYPGSVYTGGNPVTVNIYLDGALQWTDTRVISGEDTYTYFAEIDTSAGTISPM